MRLGAFQLDEPLPDLREPHALAMLGPWIDVGNVGNLTMSWLERHFEARELGRLAKPGSFFDFTRYRPLLYYSEGRREVAVPNAHITYATPNKGNDFLFLRLMEPHAHGEVFVDSVLRLLATFGVKRYCLFGSMYDLVPHTRPLLVTGTAAGQAAEQEMDKLGIEPSDYEGPTTIAFLASQRAPEMGIESMSLIVHLPQYTQLEEDYIGLRRLLGTLSSFYDMPTDEAVVAKADQQLKEIDLALEKDPQVKAIVQELENRYDARASQQKDKGLPKLSPQIESFLKEMGRRFGQN
jgi:hypothetical protein